MSKLSLTLPLVLLFVGVLPLAAQAPDPLTPNVTIAFLGDQGLDARSEAVLQLIHDEGADAVVHMGDFDYRDDPAAWDAQIDATLGPDFPYFAAVGNHDKGKFYDPGGYQDRLEARMNRLGIPWEGDLGVRSTHHFEGVFIVLTAPGTYGDGDSIYAPYIRDSLAADDSIWSISAWHKNMHRMQVGGKGDETGWGVYEESRRAGAIVATGHEHSYSRTHLLADVQDQVVASTEEPLVLAEDDPATPEDEGRTFVFVAGLGGHSIRDQETDGPWWASVYTSNQGAQEGALFGVFHYEGDPSLARFYFKDVAGNVVDDFFVTSTLSPLGPTLRIADVSLVEGDSSDSEVALGVVLQDGVGEEVTVEFTTVDGDAVAGEDYEATTGSLVFPPGVSQQSASVRVWGDESAEGDESFFVDLFAAQGALVARPRGEVMIRDDDGPPAPLLLQVNAQGSGLVTLDPPGGVYAPGTQVSLTAVAGPGHAFAGWGGDLIGAANPATIVVNGHRQVTAFFVAVEAELLQVETGGATGGSSVSTAAPLVAGSGDLYLAAVASKPDVAVTGISGLGLSWSPVRAQCAGRSQTGLAVWQARGEPTAAGVVTATFSESPDSSVLAVSRYSGVEAVDPLLAVSANSIGVAGACSGGNDDTGYSIDLDLQRASSRIYVAAAARGRDHLPGPGFVEQAEIFSGSGGSAAGVSVAEAQGGPPGTVAVDGGFDAAVDWAVVTFEIPLAAAFQLFVQPGPGGSVEIDPPFGSYVAGAPVVLTALADEGHRFDAWSGDVSGSQNPEVVLMDRNKVVGASFAPQPRVDLLPTSGGTIALDPPGGRYDEGTVVTVTAVPSPGHRFTGWTGDLAGPANPTSLVVDADAVVGAGFVSVYDVTISAGPGGWVALDPATGPYDDGSSITITAIPGPRYRFGGWSGVLAGEGNPALLVIEANETIGASFVRQFALSVFPPSGGFVTLDPPGGIYDPGTPVTVLATAEPGWIFGGWYGDLAGMVNAESVVADRDRRVGARFFSPVALQEVRGGASGSAPSVATNAAVAAAEGDLYLAAVATKPHVVVSGVSGLGLEWTPVRAQCAGRGQTGVAVWQARGQPSAGGVVSASLAETPQNATIAVSRYASAGMLDPDDATSANSLGVSGACQGGTDQSAYALPLDATTPGGLAYVATAMRHRDHLPGSGFVEQIELHQGGGGSIAGVSMADLRVGAPGPTPVVGGFDATVDWAAVAFEIPAWSGGADRPRGRRAR